jgi:hypothetical protein
MHRDSEERGSSAHCPAFSESPESSGDASPLRGRKGGELSPRCSSCHSVAAGEFQALDHSNRVDASSRLRLSRIADLQLPFVLIVEPQRLRVREARDF